MCVYIHTVYIYTQKFNPEDNIPLLFIIALCWVLKSPAFISGHSPSSLNQSGPHALTVEYKVTTDASINISNSCPPLCLLSLRLFSSVPSTPGTQLHPSTQKEMASSRAEVLHPQSQHHHQRLDTTRGEASPGTLHGSIAP